MKTMEEQIRARAAVRRALRRHRLLAATSNGRPTAWSAHRRRAHSPIPGASAGPPRRALLLLLAGGVFLVPARRRPSAPDAVRSLSILTAHDSFSS